jgi:hypothetical protein
MGEIMNNQHPVVIQIAFVDADERKPDPFAVGEEARESVNGLRAQGYTVQPAYTGAQGGDVFQIATEIGQRIVENKELLISLIGLSTPILSFLLNRYEKRVDKREALVASGQQDSSISVIFTIDQASIPVEARDLDGNERLLQKLLGIKPELIHTVTPASKPEIRVEVGSNSKRGRW